MPKKRSTRKKSTKTRRKKSASKRPKRRTSKKKAKRKPKKTKKAVRKPKARLRYPKAVKCCPHCPDYKHCKDKGACCNYCDFYFKGYCMYEKEKDLITPDGSIVIETNDYRGDDYGIDDYDAYESVYE
jgi:hypothetical protein